MNQDLRFFIVFDYTLCYNTFGENNGIYTAIIGVAGILLGTILGFLLNIWANKGKIKFVLLNDWSQGFFSDVHLDVEILNTNHYPVILRDFYIIFDKKFKKLYASQEETTCVLMAKEVHLRLFLYKILLNMMYLWLDVKKN